MGSSFSVEIENLSGVKDIKLNQCAFGARWYKPTRLRTFGLANTSELERKCRRQVCDGQWLCQYTGLPHIRLQGRDEKGMNWSVPAAAYPALLGKILAQVFMCAVLEREAARGLRNMLAAS
jgi:hypothetical protein